MALEPKALDSVRGGERSEASWVNYVFHTIFIFIYMHLLEFLVFLQLFFVVDCFSHDLYAFVQDFIHSTLLYMI